MDGELWESLLTPLTSVDSRVDGDHPLTLLIFCLIPVGVSHYSCACRCGESALVIQQLPNSMYGCSEGTPLLIQLFVIFFGCHRCMSIVVSCFPSAIIAFSLNVGAYTSGDVAHLGPSLQCLGVG